MHIEFIDLLRCPNVHEESWLVAAFYRTEGRVVIEGKLGCPVCGAEYFVRDGVATFDDTNPSPQSAAPDESVSDGSLVAAMLDLSTPGMLALLAGEWARDAKAVSELTGARIIALNSPARALGSDDVAEIRARPPIPLAAQSLNGIALDVRYSTPAVLHEATRLLRVGGRLLATASAELPPTFRELARDGGQVICEQLGELTHLRRD
jgi:uncharacterized protein YbaR (Trm112 family)